MCTSAHYSLKQVTGSGKLALKNGPG